jgi:hypothetical protein
MAKTSPLPDKIVCPGGGRWPGAAPDGEDAILYAGEVYERREVLTDDFAQKLLDVGHIADAEEPKEGAPKAAPKASASADEKGN